MSKLVSIVLLLSLLLTGCRGTDVPDTTSEITFEEFKNEVELKYGEVEVAEGISCSTLHHVGDGFVLSIRPSTLDDDIEIDDFLEHYKNCVELDSNAAVTVFKGQTNLLMIRQNVHITVISNSEDCELDENVQRIYNDFKDFDKYVVYDVKGIFKPKTSSEKNNEEFDMTFDDFKVILESRYGATTVNRYENNVVITINNDDKVKYRFEIMPNKIKIKNMLENMPNISNAVKLDSNAYYRVFDDSTTLVFSRGNLLVEVTANDSNGLGNEYISQVYKDFKRFKKIVECK